MSVKDKQKIYVVQHSALEKYRENSLSKSYMLIELLKDFLKQESNEYNREAIGLICEYVATIKKTSEYTDTIISECEPYKDSGKKIDGFKITQEEYVILDDLMVVSAVCETHLYNLYNISLIPS